MLDVAGRLANDLGYEGTQISDIVKEARISKRAFYEHFESKGACFADLIRRARGMIMESMIAAAEQSLADGPGATFVGMLSAWVERLEQAPRLYAAMRGTHEPALDAAQSEGIDRISSVFAAAADILGTTLDRKELTEISRMLTWGAFGTFNPSAIDSTTKASSVSMVAIAMCRGFCLDDNVSAGLAKARRRGRPSRATA
jgi:AcrR family transcriptional regulator